MSKRNTQTKGACDARIAVRLPHAEKMRLLAQCEAHGISFSDFLRSRIVGVKFRSRIEAQAIAELRHQGALLRQIAVASEGGDREEVREAIAVIVATVKLIGEQAGSR
ncbi:plasmid mobilization protein [Aromatoleum aromaticum]|uniref:plasmid mobilization protein n=1 Tax=Aromatoleum aromaticum TaxID=551760 RepID=UPI00145964F3|nr:hypothetical protein [Aromatoleum aromaticum]NMG56682.1 hypothetical protein [Aromatoleum aromaticum]